jgi:diadenosine tetraphosphate (Ap4A) HIT family hydrolase
MTENDSLVRERTTTECDLCNEINGKDCYFVALYQHQMRNRIVFRASDFAVMPTIGQIVEGHVLVLPFQHYTSIGGLPHSQISELEGLLGLLKRTILSSYGVQPVFFEHGTACEDKESGGCGIYHMHLHAVPLPNGINLKTSISLPMREITSLFELKGIISAGRSYVLYIDQADNKFVSENARLPSQYMRKTLADALGSRNWDWRTYEREERLVSTFDKLSKAMAESRFPR